MSDSDLFSSVHALVLFFIKKGRKALSRNDKHDQKAKTR